MAYAGMQQKTGLESLQASRYVWDMAYTLTLAPFDPFAPVPWWAWEWIEELRAQRTERQHRAYVAAGYKPHQPGDPAYLGPLTPAQEKALRESMARLMAGIKLTPPPPGFD